MIQRGVLADLNRANTRLARTQEKVASGKEITRPSDDPFKTVARAGAAHQPLRAPASTSARSPTRAAGRRRPSRRSAR
jgi:hypothetical protein